MGWHVQFKIQILNGLKPSFLRFRWLKWKSLSFLSSFCPTPEIVKSLMSLNKNYRNLFFSVKSQRSLYNWQGLTNLLVQKMPSFCVHRTIKIVKWRLLWPNGGLFTNFIGVQIARNRLWGRWQTTYVYKMRGVGGQKNWLFVNFHTIENVNGGG